MEYNVQILMNDSPEWKNSILLINENDFQIKKKIDKEGNNYIKTFSLLNASIIDNNYELNDDESIFIGNPLYNISIKPMNQNDKINILSSLNKIINNNFSYDNENTKIDKNDNLSSLFGIVTKKLSIMQNILNEMRDYNNNKNKLKNKSEINEIIDYINKMKKELDITILSFYKYNDLIIKNSKEEISLDEEKISSIVYGDDIINNFEILNSYRYHSNDLNNIGKNILKGNGINSSLYEDATSNKNILTDKSNITKNKNVINNANNKNNNTITDNNINKDNINNNNINLNQINNKDNINEFYDKNYDSIRKNLQKPLSFPPNMIKEMITNLTQKKAALPVYFNEPLSMGQKQCEKFFYLDLLNKAANESKKEIQLCYISAFIIGEIFLNIGRTLKPFNSIIGETFEYFNNNLKLRYYSEQVSHKPPINAYIGETPEFTLYGDTLGDTSFKIFKGGIELSMKNKVHIIFKKSGEHYTYVPPKAMAKGLMKPPLYADYYGDILIQNEKNPSIKCELKLIEEGWTPNSLGKIEGTVYNNDEIIYLLGGNWKSDIYMTDPEGNNKKDLLVLDQNLKYLKNTPDCYYLPEFTCDLNNINEKLEKSLPLNDSRFKKDMRYLEEGNIDEAQKFKEKYEEKQRKELNNDEHKILFFDEKYDEENENNYYVPNNKYWEMKKNNTLKDNLNSNIFDVSKY